MCHQPHILTFPTLPIPSLLACSTSLRFLLCFLIVNTASPIGMLIDLPLYFHIPTSPSVSIHMIVCFGISTRISVCTWLQFSSFIFKFHLIEWIDFIGTFLHHMHDCVLSAFQL